MWVRFVANRLVASQSLGRASDRAGRHGAQCRGFEPAGRRRCKPAVHVVHIRQPDPALTRGALSGCLGRIVLVEAIQRNTAGHHTAAWPFPPAPQLIGILDSHSRLAKPDDFDRLLGQCLGDIGSDQCFELFLAGLFQSRSRRQQFFRAVAGVAHELGQALG